MIPTARDFIIENRDRFQGLSAHIWLIEFAKLHAQAALEAAAKTHLPPQYYGETDSKPRTSHDKDVILNSYPSSLIQ